MKRTVVRLLVFSPFAVALVYIVVAKWNGDWDWPQHAWQAIRGSSSPQAPGVVIWLGKVPLSARGQRRSPLTPWIAGIIAAFIVALLLATAIGVLKGSFNETTP